MYETQKEQHASGSWLGFTYLPPADIFASTIFGPRPTAANGALSLDLMYQTPARPSRAGYDNSRNVTTTAKKRRRMTGLESYAAVVHHGMASVQRQLSPSARQEADLDDVEARRVRLLEETDRIVDKYGTLFHRARRRGADTKQV